MSVHECEKLVALQSPDLKRDDMTLLPSHSYSSLGSHLFSAKFYREFFSLPYGSMAAAMFNLASSTLGTGTLAIPYALYHSGVLISAAALLVCVTATVYSVYLLARVMEVTALTTYEEMAGHLFFGALEKLTACVVVCFNWGVAVVYIVVIGDILESLIVGLHIALYIGRQAALLLFWFFIMVPLSLGRNINSLRYASLVSVVSTLLLVAAIFTHAFQNGANLSALPLMNLGSQTFGAFNTFVFTTCCQTVVSNVYVEMEKRTTYRITFAAALSVASCSLLCFIAGVLGAADFSVMTQPNIMHNYTDELNKPYIAFAFFAIALTVTMAFSMTIFSTRESLLTVLRLSEDCPLSIHVFLSFILAFFSLLFGIFVPNVRFIFDILGGIFGSIVSFVFPAMFALRCGFWDVSVVGWCHAFATVSLFLFGVGTCALGVLTSFGII